MGETLVLSDSKKIEQAFELAIEAAKVFRGQTAPNPIVGATGLDAHENVLSVKAHERAGTSHAEALVIEECRTKGILDQLHTLVVTLEPCNHQGRMPPCTGAILKVPAIKRVIFGARDPHVLAAGGAGLLLQKSLKVSLASAHVQKKCEDLIAPFSKVVREGLPYVTLKRAFDEKGSMIPPPGNKTFTRTETLNYAHQLRKQSDAILTGSETILKDNPLFTVRQIKDFEGKVRDLIIMDRRKRVSSDYIRQAELLGFRVFIESDLEQALRGVVSRGGLEVLVEAGPQLSNALIQTPFWDLSVVMTKGQVKDEIRSELRCFQESLKV